MLPEGTEIEYLVGDPLQFCKQVFVPYDHLLCDFLGSLSEKLLQDSLAKTFPDIIYFAFWCRRANIAKLKEEFSEKRLRLGLGLVFHISPSNVPINFAFSFVFSLLAGNSNIVRVPSKDYQQTDIICGALKTVLSDAKYSSIAKMTALVRYNRNDDLTRAFSDICDGRIVWGGTQTIQEIRRLPIPERAIEVDFADRYSFCAIDAQELLNCSQKDLLRLAGGFYNDTYLMDQNACSSPHLVIWLGSGRTLSEAKNRFWDSVYKIAADKYVLHPLSSVDKLAMLYEDAIELPEISRISKHDNLLYVLDLNRLRNNMDNFRGKFGYFYQFSTKSLNEIAHIVNKKYQTLTYFGINKDVLIRFVLSNRLSGIDRIVPIGSAMDISVIWDGYDLVRTLSRICDMK